MLDGWRFTAIAAEEAIASLPPDAGVEGIVYGTEDGNGFEIAQEVLRAFDPDEFDWDRTCAETGAELIRRALEQQGKGCVSDTDVITISNACVSSNQAIGLAFQRVRNGTWKRALAGGVWAGCNPHDLMNFHILGALTVADVPAREASRPFSKDRSGFVLAEGSACLILETREEAEARNAPILGVVIGYASTSDAYRITDGRPDGSAAAAAMERAIHDAGRVPSQVDAISAHGTSTPMNDRLETLAIKHVFGKKAYDIPVVSLKSQTGHPLVAAGAFEAVACLAMLAEQRVAPTINYREFDPECDLDYVPNVSRPAKLDVILSNNLGFGGQNACVVFQRV